MSHTPEDYRMQGEAPGDGNPLCARLVDRPDREPKGCPEPGAGPIVACTASGPALAFWQAVLAGDTGSISHILSDSGLGLAPDSVFDTSDPERWRDFRFNIRALSTGLWGVVRGRGRVCMGSASSGSFSIPYRILMHLSLPSRTLVTDLRGGVDHAATCGCQPGPHRSTATAAEAAGTARLRAWGPHGPA